MLFNFRRVIVMEVSLFWRLPHHRQIVLDTAAAVYNPLRFPDPLVNDSADDVMSYSSTAALIITSDVLDGWRKKIAHHCRLSDSDLSKRKRHKIYRHLHPAFEVIPFLYMLINGQMYHQERLGKYLPTFHHQHTGIIRRRGLEDLFHFVRQTYHQTSTCPHSDSFLACIEKNSHTGITSLQFNQHQTCISAAQH